MQMIDARAAARTDAVNRSLAPADTLRGLFAGESIRHIDRRAELFFEGETRDRVFEIVCGALALYQSLPDGRRQIIAFARPGDLVGLASGANYAYSAYTTVETTYRSIPAAKLERAARANPAIAEERFDAATAELETMRNLLFSVSRRGAAERVAFFLIELSQRNALHGFDPSTVALMASRHDIGDYLGLTLETVSRVFSKFKSRGWIEYSDATTVRLADLDTLTKTVDGGR